MKTCRLLPILALALSLVFAARIGSAQSGWAGMEGPPLLPTGGEVVVAFNVRIPMRDGVALSADIYRPAGRGRHPVLVVRTPYTKSPAWARRGREWAERGYVFIVQDVRGRGDSDGNFEPLVYEAADGIDTYAWAARQTWSSGKVGGFGGSYSAWTQLYPVATKAQSLTTMLLMAVPPDPDRHSLTRAAQSLQPPPRGLPRWTVVPISALIP